jgi:hypothetical protein
VEALGRLVARHRSGSVCDLADQSTGDPPIGLDAGLTPRRKVSFAEGQA